MNFTSLYTAGNPNREKHKANVSLILCPILLQWECIAFQMLFLKPRDRNNTDSEWYITQSRHYPTQPQY